MEKINLGVIGCGYFGPNYIRVINDLLDSNVKYCADLKKVNLRKIKKKCMRLW